MFMFYFSRLIKTKVKKYSFLDILLNLLHPGCEQGMDRSAPGEERLEARSPGRRLW